MPPEVTDCLLSEHSACLKRVGELEEFVRAIEAILGDKARSATERISSVQTLLLLNDECCALPGSHHLQTAFSRPSVRLLTPKFKQLIACIEANLSAEVHVKQLSIQMGLSPSHFSRAFGRTLGMSPYRYVMHQRTERAKILMLTTDAPLARVALECGLADQAHFTRIFRKFTGVTPARWRREQRHGFSLSTPRMRSSVNPNVRSSLIDMA